MTDYGCFTLADNDNAFYWTGSWCVCVRYVPDRAPNWRDARHARQFRYWSAVAMMKSLPARHPPAGARPAQTGAELTAEAPPSSCAAPHREQAEPAAASRPPQLTKPKELAQDLNMSVKTLLEHVKAGNIAFVVIGHGKRRRHIAFRPCDIESFLEHQARREAGGEACRSTKGQAVRFGSTSLNLVEYDFAARRARQISAKPQPSKNAGAMKPGRERAA